MRNPKYESQIIFSTSWSVKYSELDPFWKMNFERKDSNYGYLESLTTRGQISNTANDITRSCFRVHLS